MACLGDEGWCSVPKMRLERLSLNEEQDGGGVESDTDSVQFPFEKVFPVYAMVGFSRPGSGSDLSVLNSGRDPIWEAVREEAKLEVRVNVVFIEFLVWRSILLSLEAEIFIDYRNLFSLRFNEEFNSFHLLYILYMFDLAAEKEPILSSFLYASILTHDCLEKALGFVLANRLQNPTLLATQLLDIFYDVIMNDKDIQRSIRLDLQAFKDRDPACLSYSSPLLHLKVMCVCVCIYMHCARKLMLCLFKSFDWGYHSLQSYRVAHALWKKGRTVLAFALQSRISEVFGIDIHPAARIGDGVLLDHGTGVVIGETAVIGNRVSLMHGVTLGGTGKEIGDRHPKVGEGALIGACVTILGNINIGEGAMIAACSLVLKEVPPHSMIAGTPAKVIGYVDEQDPSLTMNHDAGKDFFKHVAVTFGKGRPSGKRSSFCWEG
ncbi:hypothetical protein EZV62_014469 [Acer yangbiense]|uniref:serine O-acetyltransferase n=1 Tax=Acer yangbiense TaxID=1000413 RepID=A0A5C7HUB8_9ROSI|nr:hypothetical protein EZV62_014469 [Acer yangbiense]